jgi:hypothetical protein
MKLKASKKDFKGQKVLRVSYCKLQFLLKDKSPIAYSSGIYGWACDYYDMGQFYISMGYNPIGKSIDYNIVKGYEETARRYIYASDISYENKKGMLENLVNEFIKTASNLLQGAK